MRSRWLAHIPALFAELRPRALRSMREFAEAEIVSMPQGPREGLPFRCSFMPWSALLLDEFDSGRWRRMFGRGPAQAGKTLLFTVIPTLYHLFEVGESVIFGAPTHDMAYDIWSERVLPVVRSTRYARMLPMSGAGSRGGKSRAVRLRNGAILRFMGSAGDDSQRSSYTARVAILTELDHMEHGDASASEAGPADQIEARTSAYDAQARVYGECTTTTEEGRIFIETTRLGTDTRIHYRCPHCARWIEPVREGLAGWRGVSSIVAAGAAAHYRCQLCQQPWSESDRAAAAQEPRFVHRGQSVDASGAVVGSLPETHTLGLVWNGIHSPLRSMATLAEDEWRADQALDDSLSKKVHQFNWALPWRTKRNEMDVTYPFLAEHVTDEYTHDPLRAHSPGVAPDPLPAGIKFRTGQIDVQKRWLYITVDGWDHDLTDWTLFYSVVPIVPEGLGAEVPTRDMIRDALDAALAVFVDPYAVDSVWVDTGYTHEGEQENIVRRWCAEQGDGVNALVGRSQGQMSRMSGERVELAPEIPDMIQCRRQPSGDLLWFLDVDRLKDEVYFRLFRPRGAPGYHYFPLDAANETRSDRSRGPASPGWIFQHYMRAKRIITQHPKTGHEVRIWREVGRQDLWDLAAYALAGAYVTVANLQQDEPAAVPVAGPAMAADTTIRTSY